MSENEKAVNMHASSTELKGQALEAHELETATAVGGGTEQRSFRSVDGDVAAVVVCVREWKDAGNVAGTHSGDALRECEAG